jgi:hypothetical protein
MKHIKILSAHLLIIILTSCNQGGVTSINDGGGSVGMWIIPGVGTKFVSQVTQAASTTPEFDTFSITKTGQHLGGKTNVVTFAVDDFGDTEFYNIESNGDISLAGSETSDSDGITIRIFNWQTYPTGSRKNILAEPTLDTTENDEHVVQSDIRAFIGVENLSTPAGEFSTLHIRETEIDSESSLTGTGEFFSSNDVTDLWFAPSVGFFVKIMGDQSENGQPEQQSEQELFKYEHK